VTVPTELEPFLYQHRSWPADPRSLAPIRAEVRRWLESSHLGEDLVDDLVMAVSEAASNAVEHAYRPITAQSTVELTLLLDQGDINIDIVDHGCWRPPATHDTGRGRGISVIKGLVDSAVVRIDPGGTRVMLHQPLHTLSESLHAGPPDGAAPSRAGHGESGVIPASPVVRRSGIRRPWAWPRAR
jgi:anti-sigma regulatory factor (Ser/Thr protein kinase)